MPVSLTADFGLAGKKQILLEDKLERRFNMQERYIFAGNTLEESPTTDVTAEQIELQIHQVKNLLAIRKGAFSDSYSIEFFTELSGDSKIFFVH